MAHIRTFFVVLLLTVCGLLSAVDNAAINSVCPVTGKAVDATIPAVIVTIGKGERAQRLLIGVADRAAAEKVQANPAAYVDAAKANRKVP